MNCNRAIAYQNVLMLDLLCWKTIDSQQDITRKFSETVPAIYFSRNIMPALLYLF